MPLTHFQLDTVLVVCSTIAICALEDPVALVKEGLARLAEFPNHYETQYDFVEHPLNGTLAVSLFLLSTFSWVKTYLVERTVVSRAHRKMTASTWSATQPWTHTPTVVAVHGFFSFVELCLGLGAILYRDNPLWARSAAAVALFINVPTGALLTPRVGIRHLIIPVFGLYGVLRALEAFKVLYLDHRLLPNLWILANGGTAVRLVGYYVTPYSSTDGARGDLFTEPVNYTLNILLSGYISAGFVYPPVWLLLSLGIYAIAHHVWPPQVSCGASARTSRAPRARSRTRTRSAPRRARRTSSPRPRAAPTCRASSPTTRSQTCPHRRQSCRTACSTPASRRRCAP